MKNSFKEGDHIKKDKCNHDWEIINEYLFYYSVLNRTYHSFTFEADVHYNPLIRVVIDKVCLKCGECYNGFKIMKEHNKAKEKRKELAEKLWKDGCK